jgi:protein phosphatase
MTAEPSDTAPYIPVGKGPPAGRTTFGAIDVAGATHPGRIRPSNEDHFLIARFGRFLETIETNLSPQDMDPRYEEVGYGLVTADGLGGHSAGEEASRLAITCLRDLVLATPDWILRVDRDEDAERIRQRVQARFEQTSRAMTREADVKPQLHGFATTLTLAATLGKDLLVFHVGDSRAYLFRKGGLHQLTRDHTRAQQLLDAGLIKPEDLTTHQWRNRLTRMLGDHVANARPDVLRLSLEDADCLLLCTDGLTEMVDEATIAQILDMTEGAAAACQSLLDAALQAGGKDNITVVVAQYGALT